MKKLVICSCFILSMHEITKPAVMPKMPVAMPATPKMPVAMPATPKMPVAMPAAPIAVTPATATPPSKSSVISLPEITIINKSALPATLNDITINHTTSIDPNNVKTVTTATNTPIKSKSGIKFTPQITISSSLSNVNAQSQGIAGLTINSQKITFSTPEIHNTFYINNVGGIWKVTTKNSPKPKTTDASDDAKTSSVKATTAAVLKKEKAIATAKPKASKSSRSSTKVINKTMKQVTA